ncbi:MAG: class I adenylate-forming enzyme family protein [Planctomycetaceae bacterium]
MRPSTSAATTDAGVPASTGDGQPAFLDPARQRHLGDAFEAVARTCPERTALVTSQRRFTYGELLQSSTTVRDALWSDAGFQAGDRVMLWLPNGPEYIAAFYGTLRAGGVVVPTPPDVEPGRFAAIRSRSEARIVFTSDSVLRRRPGQASDKPELLPLDTVFPERGSPHGDAPDGDAPAAIFFTSGSTGEPKGVTLGHTNLLANAGSIIEYLRISADDRALGLLPFYHAFGNSVLQTHLLRGAVVVLGGSLLFPETILDAIRDAGVTSLSGVPDVFRTLLSRSSLGQASLPTLKTVAIAGGRLDPDQTQVLAFRAAPAKVFVMYGQTEATARLSYLPPEFLEERYGSIGRGIPGVELRVIDDAGQPVAPGETGEICARGPNVMLGYWRDPEGTATTLRNGWLMTGDLATIDADGFIYPQGRRSGLVKIAGFRVHPSELEEFVRREAGVLEVVAVPFETAETGTRLALFVQPWGDDGAVTAETLRGLCVAGLPRHLVPEHIEVLTQFPLNDAYKVDRRELRRRAETTSTLVEESRT